VRSVGYHGLMDHGEVLEEDHVWMHVAANIGGRIVLARVQRDHTVIVVAVVGGRVHAHAT
jgi:hypothetical protein